MERILDKKTGTGKTTEVLVRSAVVGLSEADAPRNAAAGAARQPEGTTARSQRDVFPAIGDPAYAIFSR
jgi:hypothetical protein